MNLPRLAIVGRPNVGKSALFNRICKRRLSIVDEKEGVTRDRLYAVVDGFRFPFEAIDTGGIDHQSEDPFGDGILQQSLSAIEEAESLVLVVDGRLGVTELDERLAKLLLKTGKPLTLAVNKIDDEVHEDLVHPFSRLGIKKIVPISALHGIFIDELLESAWEGFSFPGLTFSKPPSFRICLIGRPNVGKSTLLNSLLGVERSLVSPVAGTTRDIIEVPCKLAGKDYLLVDTAGIQRKKNSKEKVDMLADMRTHEAIERSDLCLMLLDVRDGLTSQEKKILSMLEKLGKGCILLLNKWDLVKGFRMEHCLKALHDQNPFTAFCPTLFISAHTKRNLDKIIPAIEKVAKALDLRVSTHQLNKFLEKTMQLNHPPMIKGKRLRIYYLTQVATRPPRFILFVNRPDLLTTAYKRYLLNQFRRHYPFPGIPLHFHLKGREAREEED